MKIIFMGSAAFAVPTLNALIENGHEVALVVTQPDKPAGRGQHMHSPPLATRAKETGLQLYQPKSIKNEKVIAKLRGIVADIIIVVAYGKILPNEIINMTKFGCVNVHSSLLPKYRGAAPINWAIVNGETESGVTTMRICEELDAGDILLQEKVGIKDSDTTTDLHDKLADIGAKLLLRTIDDIKNNRAKPIPQDGSKATFAPILKKEDGHIDWTKSAKSIHNLVRGMLPWPSAYTKLEGKLLKIYSSRILDTNACCKPGTVHATKSELFFDTGDKQLLIEELQIEGKKRMRTEDFLKGHKIYAK